MKRMLTIAIFFLAILFCSCNNDSAIKIIPEDSMRLIMWDMMKADEWFNRKIIQDTNAIRNKEDVKLYQKVFKVHGITRERYFESYRFYEAHPVSFKRILDSMDAIANRQRLQRYSNEKGIGK